MIEQTITEQRYFKLMIHSVARLEEVREGLEHCLLTGENPLEEKRNKNDFEKRVATAKEKLAANALESSGDNSFQMYPKTASFQPYEILYNAVTVVQKEKKILTRKPATYSQELVIRANPQVLLTLQAYIDELEEAAVVETWRVEMASLTFTSKRTNNYGNWAKSVDQMLKDETAGKQLQFKGGESVGQKINGYTYYGYDGVVTGLVENVLNFKETLITGRLSSDLKLVSLTFLRQPNSGYSSDGPSPR